MQTSNQDISADFLKETEVSLCVKREDLIHPLISGNKYRKLKYNLAAALSQGHHSLLTFGGAFSNHILATAAAAHENELKSIGVIRGEELLNSWHKNPTLKKADELGMQFYFVSRDEYREKSSKQFTATLNAKFGPFYLIPEGGTNSLAVKGCEEILVQTDGQYDVICCSVGTGGTMAGLINASQPHQKVLGFSSLKGSFLQEEIQRFTAKPNWELLENYHFGGYAKINVDLINFMNDFKKEFGLQLDPIYTGKLIFGLFDLIKKGYFRPRTKILAIHTGGLQGVSGMNLALKKKNLPLLNI